LALGVSYAPAHDPLDDLARGDRGAISVHARFRDYHDTLKGRARTLGDWIERRFATAARLAVDTAPVLEKPLAAAAGLGWQGKHTNLVSRRHGSWLFLAELFVGLDLPLDAPHPDRCGSCRRCLDVCPTKAFPAPYRLDARRCVSYLTIEAKGPIPRAFRRAIGNRVYGCDDCLAVCPWNRFAEAARDAAFTPRTDLTLPALIDLAALDADGFHTRFRGTPIRRIGRARFLRNVLVALGNCGDPGAVATVVARLDDAEPLARGAATWALGRLDPQRFQRERALRAPLEADPEAAAEWAFVDDATLSSADL
jgi:epoxyqueuosine reductase